MKDSGFVCYVCKRWLMWTTTKEKDQVLATSRCCGHIYFYKYTVHIPQPRYKKKFNKQVIFLFCGLLSVFSYLILK